MKHAWLVVRSAFLWAVVLIFFCLAVALALALAATVGQRRVEPLVHRLAYLIVRLAGARLSVRFADGFDKKRTGFLISNHVNLFDPFVLSAAIPVLFRGLELESHFKIPVYGWLMKRFGNVPVPNARSAAGLKRTYRLAKAALDHGINLVVLAEAGRTLDGRVSEFEVGVFRMALNLGYPITPVSIVNSFSWKRKGSRMLRPAKVEVVVHDTIETAGLTRRDLEELRVRVRDIVAAPVHAAL